MAELEKDDFLILPDNRGEVRLAAELTAGAILDSPQRLPTFSEQMGNIYLSAQMEGRDRVTLLDKYLDHVGDFSRSGWEKRQDQELTEESARAILLANPGRNGKRNIRDRIVDSVLRGFVNDRFEGPNKADWRGSIETQMTFLRAVALPDADPQLLRIWLNSLYGRGSVLPRFGLAKRALSMSRMVASPEDEKYVDMTIELGRGIRSAIYVVGEGDEAERLNGNSNHLVFVLGSGVAIYQQGLDPTRGDG